MLRLSDFGRHPDTLNRGDFGDLPSSDYACLAAIVVGMALLDPNVNVSELATSEAAREVTFELLKCGDGLTQVLRTMFTTICESLSDSGGILAMLDELPDISNVTAPIAYSLQETEEAKWEASVVDLPKIEIEHTDLTVEERDRLLTLDADQFRAEVD
jgi:hypothetical protein